MNTAEEFWAWVDASEGEGACWPWLGAKSKNGYGAVNWGARPTKIVLGAHQVAFMLTNGWRPTREHRLVVRHRCRARACCNPDHLEIGTHSENSKDMQRDGTHYRQGVPGEKNGRARLAADDVAKILTRLAKGERQIDIARSFKISQSHVSSIKLGRCWGWRVSPNGAVKLPIRRRKGGS